MNRSGPRPRSRLLRESAVGSVGAMVALGAGLALDLTLALLLGAGSDTDALFVALRIPLGVAVFFPPTAVQVLVPAISGWLEERDTRKANAHTSAMLVSTLALTGLLAVAGIVCAAPLVRVIAPGLDPAGHDLAAGLARVAFLMIPPVAASQVLRAYRHAHRRHGLATALQSVLGVTIVAILLVGQASVQVAVWAFVVGASLQFLMAWILARASGFSYVRGKVLTDETRALGRRSLRPLTASGIQLTTRLAEQMVASFLPPGSITILTYANRLVSAIGGTLFFGPVVTAFIGPMSRLYARGDRIAVRALLRDGLRIVLLISASLTTLVAVAGSPFVTGLFALGDFTAAQARVLGIMVAVYSLSLPTAALQRMLLGATFARLDTSPYLRNTVYGAVANLVLLGGLAAGWQWPLELLVVPIAYSLAQIVNVVHAAAVVRRQLGAVLPGLREALAPLVVIGAAAAVMVTVRLWLFPGLVEPPISLMAAGLVTALAGALILGTGTMRVAAVDGRLMVRPGRRTAVAAATDPIDR